MTIVGPMGTQVVVDHIVASLGPDIDDRMAHHHDLHHPPPGEVKEVPGGPVDLPGTLSVSCSATDHRPVETAPHVGIETLVPTHYVPPFPPGRGEEWREPAAAHLAARIELGDDLDRVGVVAP